MRILKVLDLYSGLNGWSGPFKERGHKVFRIDNDPQFKDIDLCADMRKVHVRDIPFRPDIILASPPCTSFSMMSCSHYWIKTSEGKFIPKKDEAKMYLALVRRCLYFKRRLKPKFFIMENPRGLLRKFPVAESIKDRRTVTYCQLHTKGEGPKRMKPTDLWGDPFPPGLKLPPMCKNGDPCHVRAPRGSYTGTQGMGKAESAKIPHKLALAVCKATEDYFNGSRR